MAPPRREATHGRPQATNPFNYPMWDGSGRRLHPICLARAPAARLRRRPDCRCCVAHQPVQRNDVPEQERDRSTSACSGLQSSAHR